MPKYDAIFFDFDGVLIDSEPVHWVCWRDVIRPLGADMSWEFYRDHCIGIDDRDMLKMIAGNGDWRRLWEQYPAKKALFHERMITAPPFPSTLAATLERLKGTYRMAVVSSSSREEIVPLIERAGLLGYFDTVVGGGDVTKHKPNPEPYLLAASRLGASRAVVFEDSAAGMQAGRAAGFQVFHVKHPNDLPEVLNFAGI